MNIHEYQGKEVLKRFGIPVLPGKVAGTSAEAVQATRELGGNLWVLKAQIYAGGRGKAGGVILCKSRQEIEDAANKLIGSPLVTAQTGPEGKVVHRVYIESGCQIDRELYLGLLLDRSKERIVVVASPDGGVDIEEIAHKSPEKIMHFDFDPATGFQPYHGRKVAFFLGLKDDLNKQMVRLLRNLYTAFVEMDCSQIEINPLVVTKNGDLVALDAKVSFDDSAIYRHPDVEAMRDLTEETPMAIHARNLDLSYVKLNGNIGCMVNGAGLAMATMDLIKLHGGEPANFLDVGGGADKDKVEAAFRLILSDPSVNAILVNIFGGIMHCNVIAEGIVAAMKEAHLTIPLVVRLQGTNRELGDKILAESGLPIITELDLSKAAYAAVQATNIKQR